MGKLAYWVLYVPVTGISFVMVTHVFTIKEGRSAQQ